MPNQNKPPILPLRNLTETIKARPSAEGEELTDILSKRAACTVYQRQQRALFACTLDAYVWNGLILEAEYYAGLKFAREYMRSSLKMKVSGSGSGTHGDFEMAFISAINSNVFLKKAYKILSMPQRELLVRVCVENHRAGGSRKLQKLRKALGLLVALCGFEEK